jgi:hypothetical protein
MCPIGGIYFWQVSVYIGYKIMRDICLTELNAISGGVWCTWNGYPGNGAANQIEIMGDSFDDCLVLRQQIQINKGGFDTAGMVMTAAFAWSGAIVGLAAGYAFGAGAVATAGVCFIFAIGVGAGYAVTHR